MKRLLYCMIIGMFSVFSIHAQTLKEVNSKPIYQRDHIIKFYEIVRVDTVLWCTGQKCSANS